MQRLMSVLLLVAAACGGDGSGSVNLADAPTGGYDAASSSDGASFQGLMIEWVASPMLPGPQNTSTMIDVTSAKFHIKKLEAIGDGGAVPEATLDEFDIQWNAVTAPPPIYFTSAPPAIYSKIRLGIDKGSSNAPSLEIRGTVQVNGTTEMFEVTSTQKADLEIGGYAVTLGVGESEGMPILVGLDALLADVDWMSLPVQNNVRRLDDTRTSEIDALFDQLENTFEGPNE